MIHCSERKRMKKRNGKFLTVNGNEKHINKSNKIKIKVIQLA
jgi:hypothetical protein